MNWISTMISTFSFYPLDEAYGYGPECRQDGRSPHIGRNSLTVT